MPNGIGNAGAVVSVSAGIPATYDSAGFAALSWSVLGEVTSLPDSGEEYADIPVQVIGDSAGGTDHYVGVQDQPESTISYVRDISDAGQVILAAASGSTTATACKIVYSNSEIEYFQMLVFSFRRMGGEANAVRMGQAKIRIDKQGVVDA